MKIKVSVIIDTNSALHPMMFGILKSMLEALDLNFISQSFQEHFGLDWKFIKLEVEKVDNTEN